MAAGLLFFAVYTGDLSSRSSKIWTTDGTPEGTRQVKDSQPIPP